MVQGGKVNGSKGRVWVLWRKWWWWCGAGAGAAEEGAGREKKRPVACSERSEALRGMLRGKEKSISRAAALVGDERYKGAAGPLFARVRMWRQEALKKEDKYLFVK